MSESNTPTTEGNLRALAWIVTEADPSQELDAQYVYRREIDLSQAIPRPRYYRAEQKDVLADDSPWDFARFWEQCDEAGVYIGAAADQFFPLSVDREKRTEYGGTKSTHEL